MMTSVADAPSPASTGGFFMVALDQLRAILAENHTASGVWGNAATALSGIEQGLQQQLETVRAGDVSSAEIERTPTLARMKKQLCRLYADLREQALALKWEAHRAAEPVSSEPVPVITGLYGRCQRFLEDLEQALGAENSLVLESVTTDVGVGD